MTATHRLAPLCLHARGDLGLVLAQESVLAHLGEDRHARVLGLACVHQRIGRREHVRFPVDPPTGRYRLPGLVVERERGQTSPWAGEQHQMVAVEQLLGFDHKLALDQRAHLLGVGIFLAAGAVGGDEREPA